MGINFSRSISQSFLPRTSYRSRMKVLAVAVFLIGSASALGSGPYLPSGWRPQGPAFLLPSEVEEPIVPLNDGPVHDVEASGSDFLREYGPPKIVSQDITQQGLPEVATERSFAFIEVKVADEAEGVTEDVSLNTEENSSIQIDIETATESKTYDEENDVETEALVQENIQVRNEESPRSLQVTEELQEDKETEKDVTEDNTEVMKETSEVPEEITQVVQDNKEVTKETGEVTSETSPITQENSEMKETADSVATEEKDDKKIEEYMKVVDASVKSITETLVSLENETLQDVTAKNTHENIGTIREPKDFLEYGPPGFKEYGPPKEDILRSENVVEAKSSADATETNEARRRRFSPKFKRTIRRRSH